MNNIYLLELLLKLYKIKNLTGLQNFCKTIDLKKLSLDDFMFLVIAIIDKKCDIDEVE